MTSKTVSWRKLGLTYARFLPVSALLAWMDLSSLLFIVFHSVWLNKGDVATVNPPHCNPPWLA
jgi:hypothetical protein